MGPIDVSRHERNALGRPIDRDRVKRASSSTGLTDPLEYV